MDNFEIFKDRTDSLIKRWDKYSKKHPEIPQAVIVRLCMNEINDDYTKELMKVE